jgi:hypothetical protein
MKISLKTKLIITFFILIFVPMGVLGSVSYTMTSNFNPSICRAAIKGTGL